MGARTASGTWPSLTSRGMNCPPETVQATHLLCVFEPILRSGRVTACPYYFPHQGHSDVTPLASLEGTSDQKVKDPRK